MPVEFVHDAKDPKDAYKLFMAYDGSGRCKVVPKRVYLNQRLMNIY